MFIRKSRLRKIQADLRRACDGKAAAQIACDLLERENKQLLDENVQLKAIMYDKGLIDKEGYYLFPITKERLEGVFK